MALALLGVSAATDAAGPVQRAQTAHTGQSGDRLQTASAMPAQTVDMMVGAQQQVAIGHTLQRVAIGDPAVADVLIIKGDKRGGVLLVGKAAGTTSLMVWTRDRDAPLNYTVNVVTPAAAALLGPDTSAVKVLGKTAVVSGSSSTTEAHQRAVVAAEGSVGKDGCGVRQLDGGEPRGGAGRRAGSRVQPFGAEGGGLQLLQDRTTALRSARSRRPR